MEVPKDKNVIVVGAGLTGVSATKALLKLGNKVLILDENKVPQERAQQLISLGADVKDDIRAQSKIAQTKLALQAELSPQKYHFALMSPGVSPSGIVGELIRAAKIPFCSELDFAQQLLGRPLIAVTGTNGKSTTVSLITAMLEASGIAVHCVGNIGVPLLDLFDGATKDLKYIAEVSSYQLELANEFSPQIAVWLNLSKNHLERHGSMENYLLAKSRIFLQQSSIDFAILGETDPHFKEMAKYVRGKLLTFNQVQAKYSLADCKLIGKHNRLNISASILAAQLAGATEEGIKEALRTFTGLEHRIEHVRNLNGVTIINDSKSTTVAATEAAIEALSAEYAGLHLLVGGKAKEGGWDDINQALFEKVRSLTGFGADGEMIIDTLSKIISKQDIKFLYRKEIKDSLQQAVQSAVSGDAVLFSPGCASFDAFQNFEERGREFKRIVECFASTA
jgi:UDP-N-acetylmuramoylalanine--D-glutamate ligase